MSGIPLVRAAAPSMTVAFLDRIGAPVDKLLARVQLSRRTLADPEALVPAALSTRFLEEASRLEGIEDLGMRVAEHVLPKDGLGIFGRLIAQSLTVRDAIWTSHRFWPAFSTGEQVWMTHQGSEVQVHHRYVMGNEERPQSVAKTVLLHLNFLRDVVGGAWRPSVVRVSARPSRWFREVPILSDAVIEFDQPSTCMTFPIALLATPLPRRMSFVSRPERAEWERSAPAGDLGGSLRQLVTTLLPIGYPDIGLVAESVGLCERTLQHRLAEDGLTYTRLVAQARFGVAQRLLADRGCKLIDIAFELGYSDPAHFTRAFRRWTGISPREFRQQQLNGGVA